MLLNLLIHENLRIVAGGTGTVMVVTVTYEYYIVCNQNHTFNQCTLDLA